MDIPYVFALDLNIPLTEFNSHLLQEEDEEYTLMDWFLLLGG